jgi:AcrR family transcriptional regulator
MTRDYENAKLALIRAGEKLFARQGIEAVSLRQIAIEAGNGNTNAVQYHFETRFGLVQAIFELRVFEMEHQRRGMLQAAEAAGLLSDARSLVDMIMLPILGLADEDGRHPYASFLSQYLTRYRLLGVHVTDRPHPNSEAISEIYRLLRERIFYVPEVIRDRRIYVCTQMFINLLIEHDSAVRDQGDEEIWQAQIRDTLDVMAVALCAPFSHPDGGMSALARAANSLDAPPQDND